MADEISQVMDMEIKGVYYLLRGSKEAIVLMARAIDAVSTWQHKKWLEKPGSCSWQKIQQASEGMAPILEFPKEMFEETVDLSKEKDMPGKGMISPFEYYCRKHGLRYCIMPDLDPDDDYIPVAVPSQEFAIHDEQIKSYMRKRIKAEEDKDAGYEKKIKDEEQKLKGAQSVSEKEDIRHKIIMLQDAKEQNSALLGESREKLEKGNVIEFTDYLKQGSGTVMDEDPETALMQAESCGLIRQFGADECMAPIRDASLIPEGREVYYCQKAGKDGLLTIRRRFETDEDGLAFSIYSVTDPETGKDTDMVSDRGCSKEIWEEKLPGMLKGAGMLKDDPFIVIKDRAALEDYEAGLRTNFTKARTDGQGILKDAKDAVSAGWAELRKKKAYEKSFYETVTVPASRLCPSDGRVLSLDTGSGLIEGIKLVDMEGDTARISIKRDGKYRLISDDGKNRSITGSEVLEKAKGIKAAATLAGKETEKKETGKRRSRG